MLRLLVNFLTIFYLLSDVTPLTPEEKTPSLAPDERFRDLFPLTRSNFSSVVLGSVDAWIVVFHNGSLDLQWKTMATSLRGVCWVGAVDTTTETELLADMKADVSSEVARVYPHGSRKRKWQGVKNQNEARSVAVTSLPDTTLKMQGQGVQDFIAEALMSKPSRFPVYFISDEEDPPAFIKALSFRFQKYFHFGRIVKPSSDDITLIGLGDKFVSPPSLFVVMFQDGNLDKINAVQFDLDKNGFMNYTNLLQFLFTINSEFRHQLPGDNRAGSKQEAEMTDILEIEAARFEFVFSGAGGSSEMDKLETHDKNVLQESNERRFVELDRDEL